MLSGGSSSFFQIDGKLDSHLVGVGWLGFTLVDVHTPFVLLLDANWHGVA